MSGTKPICGYNSFPIAFTKECEGNETNCIDKVTLKGKGVYDCVCPSSYKLNGKNTLSSKGGKQPLGEAIPKDPRIRIRGNNDITQYNVSCK